MKIDNLTNQSRELLESSFNLRRILAQVIPPDLIDYIMELIALDDAHQKFLQITKED